MLCSIEPPSFAILEQRVDFLQTYWRGEQGKYAEQRGERLQFVKDGIIQVREPGSYAKRSGEITTDLLMRHVKGQQTIGQYQINSDNLVHWVCYDVDQCLGWDITEERDFVIAWFNNFDFTPVVEESSTGRFHLWLLLSHGLDAEVAFNFGKHLKAAVYKQYNERIAALDDDTAMQLAVQFAPTIADAGSARDELYLQLRNREWFPKQAHRKDFGNLVRLPWGLHQKKKVWSSVLTEVLTVINSFRFELLTAKLDSENPNPFSIMRRATVSNASDRKMTNLPKSAERGTTAYQSFVARIEAVNQRTSMPSVLTQLLGFHVKAGDTIQCPFHGSPSSSPALLVGRSNQTCGCQSTKCRTYGKHFSPFNFLRELRGYTDATQALEAYEELA